MSTSSATMAMDASFGFTMPPCVTGGLELYLIRPYFGAR